MRNTVLALTVAAMAAGAATGASAQNQLTRNQIINSLQETTATVARLDPAAMQAAADRAAASGGDNAPGPLFEHYASLPQISVQINFALNSARILPSSYEAVGLIADALHSPYLMHQLVVVVGNTDATGTREYNLKLSKERAASVRDALVTTFAVPAEQLVAIGLGEEQLQDPGNPDAAINRRVQLINLGPAK